MGSSGSKGLSSLITRAITAFVYAAVMLGTILFGRPLGLGLLISLVGVLAAAEFYSITRREHRLPNEVLGLLAVGAMPTSAALWGWVGLMSAVTVLVVGALAWHIAFRQVKTTDTAVTVFGALYVGFLLSFFVLIRQLDGGTILALATILSVWASDVFAYFVGSAVGRHKMAPRISPNKSWEGFFAGLFGSMGVWVLAGFTVDIDLSFTWLLFVGLATGLAAVLGDLFESRIKRESGVKDSGTLLPGHGGFLDRFDSLILVSIVAYQLLSIGLGQ